MHTLRRFMAASSLLLCGWDAPAVEPESGIYWSVGRPGEGLLIERQGDQIGIVLYTYSAAGEPEFYVAGGVLEEGGDSEPATWTEGYFPLHQLRATLFRTSDGPRFNSVDRFTLENGRELQATPVGTFRASFLYDNFVDVTIQLDELPADAHPLQRDRVTVGYHRTNFGFAGYGTDAILSTNNPNPPPCWTDLSGTWTFVDTVTDEREVWRFDFELEEIAPPAEEMSCPIQRVSDSHVLVYKDAHRGATLRCVNAPGGDPLDGRKHIPGCEVTQDGADEPLFYFYREDIGLKRMVGSKGPFPSAESGVLRRAERIVGIRVD